MTTTDNAMRLNQVTISLGDTNLLELDCVVEPAGILTIMGPSGSGKSTLLAFIGGFLDPAFSATGEVSVGNIALTALPPEDRHVGILFQDPLLFPHMSVLDNLLFAIPARVKDRGSRAKIAVDALKGVGLDGFGDRDPDTLSGGQKARVALARVLVSEPRALLLDEPFSSLDADRRDRMRRLVFDKARDKMLPVILVTHDEADARAAGGLIIRIGGDGSC